MSDTKKNLGYQTAYTIINTCVPLITSPYLSRVLEAKQLGVFSYSFSVITYFMLFAALGIENHGTRTIAAAEGDDKKNNSLFWTIYAIELFASVMAIIAYIVFCFTFCNNNRLIFAIMGFELLASMLTINWLFFGLGEFKLSATRNIITKLATVVCIFIFVKSPSDLWKYTAIMVAGNVLSQFILWFYLPKAIKPVRIRKTEFIDNVKQVLILFIPILAMSVYQTMDKTMLGLITGESSGFSESGFYYNADKIVNIPIGVIGGIGTVLLPKITGLIAKKDTQNANRLFCNSLELSVLVASAMAFGIAAVAKEFTPIFFGPGYEPCILLIVVLAPVMLIKAVSISARNQYLIPYHYDSKYIQSVLLGVVVNLFSNILLIPRYGALGAVIGTLLAELAASAVQMAFICRKVNRFQMLLLYIFRVCNAYYGKSACALFTWGRFMFGLRNNMWSYFILSSHTYRILSA